MTPAGIVVTGSGLARGDAKAGDDVLRWLVSRKSRKFMGKQDELAVIAAGRALEAALLQGAAREAAAVYLTVGHIPFEQAHIEAIVHGSTDAAGAFDIRRFAREGIEQVNPLLTFRCLPNMPAYHVSVNFDIRGAYVVSYPGIAQCCQALDQAVHDLRSGRCTHALLGAVADQCNFLVGFHFERSAARASATRGDAARVSMTCGDAAAFVCLETEATARERGAHVFARLGAWSIDYDPAADVVASSSACTDLVTALHEAITTGGLPWHHAATSADHCRVSSRWERA